MQTSLPARVRPVVRPFGQFASAFLTFFRGFGFLARHSALWPWAILPFAINFVIVLAATAALLYFFSDLTGLLLSPPEAWYGWFWYVPYIALCIVLIPFLGYVLFFVILPGIVSPVFKGRLTKHTRQILKGTPVKPAGGFWVDVVLPTVIELRKAGRLILVTLALLPLNLVPILGNAAYLVLVSYFTWMHMALNYLEYPIDSESFVTPLSEKRRYIRRHRWSSLGFGCALSLTCLVPFLNFFCVPVGVVGATLLYQDLGEVEPPFGPGAGGG